MNMEIVISAVLLAVFSALAAIMLFGKGDFLIKKHIRESQKYNIHRLRVIHAATFILVCIAMILVLCLPDKQHIAILVIVPVAIVLAILQFTWAKRE